MDFTQSLKILMGEGDKNEWQNGRQSQRVIKKTIIHCPLNTA